MTKEELLHLVLKSMGDQMSEQARSTLMEVGPPPGMSDNDYHRLVDISIKLYAENRDRLIEAVKSNPGHDKTLMFMAASLISCDMNNCIDMARTKREDGDHGLH